MLAAVRERVETSLNNAADAVEEVDDTDADTDLVEDSATRFGVRWKVLGPTLVSAFGVVAALTLAMANGVLAVTFSAQSGTVALTTDGLNGDDLGIAVVTIPTKDADGSSYNVRIGVGAGRINGLCISQHVGILGQPFTLMIKGGDNDPNTYEIVANGLLLDVTQAKGVIGAKGDLEINKNGADVSLGTTGIDLGASSDRFGLQASSAQLKNIVATVRDINIPNLLQVPNFTVQVVPGTKDCPAPGTGTGAGS